MEEQNINSSVEIISLTDPKSSIAEAYHTLRTNILFAGLDNPIKSVLVTSALPQSGKTTTVANLGVTIARTGANVLIIDVDLRRSSQHHIFKLNNDVGLTSLLVDENLNLEDAVQKTGVANLSVLTSGPLPPNPSELIVSKPFKNLIKRVKDNYDFVLIDSPPIIAVTDPALLSHFVDGTILVVDFGRVPREMAQKAKEQLVNVRANIIGVVLNKIPANGHGYYYYYYNRYYGEGAERVKQSGKGRKHRPKRASKRKTFRKWLQALLKKGYGNVKG